MGKLTDEEKEIVRFVRKYHKENQEGMGIQDIAEEMDISRSTASKRLDMCERMGFLRKRIKGNVKLFYPKSGSQKV